MKRAFLSLVAVLVLLPGCSDDDTPGTEDAGTDAIVRPDVYVGACNDDPVPVFEGSHQTLLSDLGISSPSRGFDLDYDGDPDNLLGPLGSVANGYIEDSMAVYEIVIPMEFFGLDDAQNDDCFNFVFYIGMFPPDNDQDGEKTSAAAGDAEDDCNDWDATINSGNATDVPGDGVDNNCDGLADETLDASGQVVPSTDDADYDGDGWSLADGDCDDRLTSEWADAPEWWDPTLINPDQVELCGDGFDNNCDGQADENCDALSTADGVDEAIPIDAVALNEDHTEAYIVFRSGRVEEGVLHAGPSVFSFSVDVEGRPLELNLTNAMMTANVTIDQYGLYLTDGMLGGVLSGQSLDRVPNIASDFLGGDENSTMLDIIVGSVGTVLSLPTLRICVPRREGVEMMLPVTYCERNDDCGDTELYRCKSDVRAPDIDVDDDGLEIFLDLNLDGDSSIEAVDTCIDGDGTMVQDTLDASGMIIEHCTQVLDEDGNARFVDGYSIALDFDTVPTFLRGMFDTSQ